MIFLMAHSTNNGRSALTGWVTPLILVAFMLLSRPIMADVRMPIQIEVQPGAAACAPGYKNFDEGFRGALNLAQLATVDTARGRGVIANSFCLASERPSVHPIRVEVRIRCDAGEVLDHPSPTPPAAAHEADHWLVDVAVPFRGLRLAPALGWQRSSLWARSDQNDYCEKMGRVIALYALEALHRETGKLRPEQFLDLGPGMNRDRKYSGSEGSENFWRSMGYWFVEALPAAIAWAVVLLAMFLAVVVARGRQRTLRLVDAREPAANARNETS